MQDDNMGSLAVIDPPQGELDTVHEVPNYRVPPDIEIEDAQVDARTEDDRLREEILELIQKKEIEVGFAESNWEEAKAEATEARKVFDKRVEELRNLVRRSKNLHEETPLFNQRPTPQEAKSEEVKEAEVIDETWKQVKLAEALIDVPENVIEKLEQNEPPMRTMGELTAWLNADQGRNRLTDIKGIGRAKEDQIEEALAAFWTRWQGGKNGTHSAG